MRYPCAAMHPNRHFFTSEMSIGCQSRNSENSGTIWIDLAALLMYPPRTKCIPPNEDSGSIFQHAFTGSFVFPPRSFFISHLHIHTQSFSRVSLLFISAFSSTHVVSCYKHSEGEQDKKAQYTSTPYTAEYNAQKKPRYYF